MFPHVTARWNLLAVIVVPAIGVGLWAVGSSSSAGSRPASFRAAGPASPVDPLTASEIETAFRVIQGSQRFPKGAFFPIVTLDEPPKSAVLAWHPGRPFARRAFANVYDRTHNRLFEAIVDLRAKRIVSWRRRPHEQPAVFPTEFADADAIVRTYKPWRAAMLRRGIAPKDVYLDVWAPGDGQIPPTVRGHRLLRALSFFRGKLPNPYDRPIEGVVVTVDMNTSRVVGFVDSKRVPVNTQVSGSAPRRPPLAPLEVVQPRGPGFRIAGTLVTWQGWRFRIGYSPREGLVLYRIGYTDNGVYRPIIYRMSMDEIYVPYSLPDPNWRWRTAFDIGEYNLGQYAEPLKSGVDVPTNAVFFDEAAPSDTGLKGGTVALPHAIALYERDAGSLWDRSDPSTLARDVRAARELVVTWTSVIGNYTYATSYVFRMDGGIDVQVAATGTTLNQGVSTPTGGGAFGTPSARYVAEPNHQHFFNFRIDFDVDGTSNRLVEENIRRLPGAGANAFVDVPSVLPAETFRDASPTTTREWAVQSTTKRNALGLPTAYALTSLDSTQPYSSPGFAPLKRAPFAQHPLWVTQYHSGQLYAAGDYPNQGQVGEGLAAYAGNHERVDGKDLVVWVTTSFTHHPATEEYPVMATESIGFQLRPDGFFDRNPALTAP
jgi:primary-amine oxidase